MKTEKEELGKVSLTCNGQWSGDKFYDRLCIVHDGFYASYISRKAVPKGIALSEEEYWQPIAKLREDVVIDHETFKKEILELIAVIQRGLRGSRMVVNDMEARDTLTYKEVGVGCEVYILETKKSWILDEITPVSNAKVWHLEMESNIDSVYKNAISGTYPRAMAERAIADEFGINIQDNYLRRNVVVNYIAHTMKKYFEDNAINILSGQITPEMLSETVKQMFTASQIINAADEEDLTVVDNTLKFADKLYNVNQYSGKARKYLRKNIIDGVNVLTQEMINEPNTIYILQYDYCLNNATITFPDNSIILWHGGKLYEGFVKLNKCRLLSNYYQQDMFDKDTIQLDGDWATGQVLYHPLDLGEDNKQVEIVGWGGNYTNDFYWFWDGEKWVSLGFDLSVYLTRAEFEAFLEKLRDEMEKFYAWLLEELKKINDHLTIIDGQIIDINNKINDINTRITNLINNYDAKFTDVYNQINNLSEDINNKINNLEQYINNKIDELRNEITSGGDDITNEYQQYFEDNFSNYLYERLKAGTNITITKDGDFVVISSTGGGGGGEGGGLTVEEVNDLINAALNNYYTKTQIDEIIAGIDGGGGGGGDTPLMSTVVAGKAKCGKYLNMDASSSTAPTTKDRVNVSLETFGLDLEAWLIARGWSKSGGGGGGGIAAETIQTWLTSLLPIGSIMLWESNTIPKGWEIYTAAQGRFVMSYKPGGVNLLKYSDKVTNNAEWQTQLRELGSIYGGNPDSMMAYQLIINSTDLPAHQHAFSVSKSKSGDGNHNVIAPASWRGQNGSEDLNSDVKNGWPYGGADRNDNYQLSNYNMGLTGPNTEYTTIQKGKTSVNLSKLQNNLDLYLNKMLPTITLHYIKRVSNPW